MKISNDTKTSTLLILGKSPLGVDYTLELHPKDEATNERLVKTFKKLECRAGLDSIVDAMYTKKPRVLMEEGLLHDEATYYKLEIIE